MANGQQVTLLHQWHGWQEGSDFKSYPWWITPTRGEPSLKPWFNLITTSCRYLRSPTPADGMVPQL
jgi:hypothetical protein